MQGEWVSVCDLIQGLGCRDFRVFACEVQVLRCRDLKSRLQGLRRAERSGSSVSARLGFRLRAVG